ncbi:hypothetical protein D770_24940 [Flammeovirgaceae bacterium 311]|nr:hypothetical protein D770_24940 [Flammeovirgaceae bacterium 311]
MSFESRDVNCEITGLASALSETVVLTKVNGIIVLKNFDNPQVDALNKTIYSSSKPPLKYYAEINVPDPLKGKMGRLFSFVDDEDELEQSTAILSKAGREIHTMNQLVPFLNYVDQYQYLKLPETMFMAIVDVEARTSTKFCDSWAINFNSAGKKFYYKKILAEKRESQTFGTPGVLMPGYDLAFGDCSQKNPHGTGYLFKTDNTFHNANFSCNESAVEFCKNNNCLVYFMDFLNQGKLRVLSRYTEDINKKLQNPYLFRSSNI